MRIACSAAPSSRAFAIHCSGLKAGGRKFSKASHGVNTTRATRSGLRVSSSCVIAPPVSLATIVTSVSSRRSMNSAIRSATPVGVSALRSRIGSRCEPSGSVGTTQR